MFYAEILGKVPSLMSFEDVGNPGDSGQLLFEGDTPIGPIQATGQFFIPLSTLGYAPGLGYNRFSFTGSVVLQSQTVYSVQFMYSSIIGVTAITAVCTFEAWLVGR
jgi:hypothetical protein